VEAETSPDLRRQISPEDLHGKAAEEIRQLADALGLEPFGTPDEDGNFRKWRDPETREQRLRLDQGHVDKRTGQPYDDPRAAVPHAHAYDAAGNKIRDPVDGNPHFPLRVT